MSTSSDSFPPTLTQALRVQPPGDVPASSAARAFNLQLTRIDKLKAQLDALDALGQSHRVELQQWVAPLQRRQRQRTRELALWLAECLQGKTLSRLQHDTATDALCRLAQTLAEEGDKTMAALHDQHSRLTLAQKKQAAADALRAKLEAVLGEPLADTDPDAPVEELLRAGMARWREAQEEAQARRRDKKNARKARQKPGAEQEQALAQQTDADTQLRTLFRQLASALHPDREPDAQERLRKTALMGEANAAYGRKDLVTLMQIQLRAELSDPAAISRLADDKLAALTLLLKQQVADLERERAARQERLAAEFDLQPGAVTNPNTLKQSLQTQVEALEHEVAQLERDLEQVQEPAGLKRWLNAQRSRPAHTPANRDPDDYC